MTRQRERKEADKPDREQKYGMGIGPLSQQIPYFWVKGETVSTWSR